MREKYQQSDGVRSHTELIMEEMVCKEARWQAGRMFPIIILRTINSIGEKEE